MNAHEILILILLSWPVCYGVGRLAEEWFLDEDTLDTWMVVVFILGVINLIVAITLAFAK